MNRVWENELRAKVMQSQYDALGISVERDYMRDLLKQNQLHLKNLKMKLVFLMKINSMNLLPTLKPFLRNHNITRYTHQLPIVDYF